MKHHKISFCTVCMNRLHHLKETLPVNIGDNENYPELEFVILDYNSGDELEEYIKINMHTHIRNGRLLYYKTNAPVNFDRSHSRNLCFKLATGDIVCNVDADNYTGKDFAFFINERFNLNSNVFLTTVGAEHSTTDSLGRICMKKDDFITLRGFDERMSCYGFEDNDMVNRLLKAGISPSKIQDACFMKSIQHGTLDRIANEYILKNLHTCFICYLEPGRSVLLFLLNNHTFFTGTIINNRVPDSDKPFARQQQPPDFENSLQEETWIQGTWNEEHSIIQLSFGTYDDKLIQINNGKCYIKKSDSFTYYVVTNGQLLEKAVMLHSQLTNRTIMITNAIEGAIMVNRASFGKGIVHKNFGQEPITIN
jgi:glycosyltransferase involved in cell wall biosynthesis